MLGQFSVAEEKRLVTTEPFEYGRTSGNVFGFALTEIVLTFVGLGFVLKAVNASPRLARLSKHLASVGDKLAKASIVQRGLKAVQVVGEVLNSFERRLLKFR